MKLCRCAVLVVFVWLSCVSPVLSAIINPDDPAQGWKDPRAYRPYPLLFLHGFASGSPRTWTDAGVDTFLRPYFEKYYDQFSSAVPVLPSSRYPYLEIYNFGDTLVDRNSSVDTYKAGDRYVAQMVKSPGDQGWSDKATEAIRLLAERYFPGSLGNVCIVAHSMGGLAARVYLKQTGIANNAVNKIILISVPNKGSVLATVGTHSDIMRNLGWFLPVVGWLNSVNLILWDKRVERSRLVDINGDAVWDMDHTFTGSGFINALNTDYASNICEHYVIAARHWTSFNRSDGVVPLESQLATNLLTLRDSVVLKATHATVIDKMLTADSNGVAPLLKFIDSSTPEISMIYPDAAVTETNNLFINLKGEVSYEYLPADSQVIIKLIRSEDSQLIEESRSLLKPSDLWNPADPASAVAEFDELIAFPGPGRYKITCQAQNPAGLLSDEEEMLVVVNATQETGVIVHCHNPEGIEIGSIRDSDPPVILVGDLERALGAQVPEEHDRVVPLEAGTHTVGVRFNGVLQEQQVTLDYSQVKTLTFVFQRETFDLAEWVDSKQVDYTAHREWAGEEFQPAPNIDYNDSDVFGDISIEFYDNYTAVRDYPWVSYTDELNARAAITSTGFIHFFSIRTSSGLIYTESYTGLYDTVLSIRIGGYRDFDAAGLPGAVSGFQRWYVQSIVDGYSGYITLGVRDGGDIFSADIITASPDGVPHARKYFMAKFPAQGAFIFARFGLYGAFGDSFAIGATSVDGWEAEQSITRAASISGLSMASVPYDLTAEGF